MGCNCGKKGKVAKKSVLGKTKEVVRNLWEKTQQETKPVNVTRINKK